jgi:hypothetical protein
MHVQSAREVGAVRKSPTETDPRRTGRSALLGSQMPSSRNSETRSSARPNGSRRRTSSRTLPGPHDPQRQRSSTCKAAPLAAKPNDSHAGTKTWTNGANGLDGPLPRLKEQPGVKRSVPGVLPGRRKTTSSLTGAAVSDAEVATFDPTRPNGRVVGRVSTVEQNGSNGSSFSFDFVERGRRLPERRNARPRQRSFSFSVTGMS